MRQHSAVLLPNWVRFDLTEPIKEPLRAAVRRMLSEVPKGDAKQVRGYLQDRLFEMLTQLASSGTVEVFMPTDDPRTASAFPIFSIRAADFTVDGEAMDPMDYLVGLVAGGAAGLIEPEGMVGVRRVIDHDTTEALRQEMASTPADIAGGLDREASAKALAGGRMSRQIEYIIGVPQSTDQWMAVTASLSVVRGEGSEELLEAVTSFADSWVETIGWVEGEAHA